MAKTKVRRIIRKIKPARAELFDEQLWPIQLALVILGGFLIGLILAYLRFNDLRWWANATTWLAITPIGVAALMVMARFVDRRLMRRAVQLSLAICILVHLILGVVMFESTIFRSMFPENPQVADVAHERVPIPDYNDVPNPQQRQRQDFHEPVETETPEPEQHEELQQERLEEPRPIEQVQPQPVPVPEPEQTVRPAEVEQRRPSETAPRMSDQQSQLSRQTTQTAPQPIAQAVAAPSASEPTPQPATPAPTSPAIERQPAETQAQRRPVTQEPATPSEQPQTQLARRETQASPIPQSTAAPTLERRVAEPQITPRTEVAPVPQVAEARETSPQEPQPNRVAVARETQTATPVERTPAEAPEAPSQTAAQVQRRQVDSPEAPTVAQAPAPNPQQRTETRTRPEIAAMADNPAPSQAPQPAPAAPRVTPQTNPVQRQTAPSIAQRATPVEAPSPTPTQQPSPSPLARRETQSTPSPTTDAPAAQPMERRTTQQVAAANTRAQPTQAPGAESPSPQPTPTPANTAIAWQATSSPATTQSAAAPSPATPAADASPTGSRTATRRLSAEPAPTIAQTPTPTPGQRRAVTDAPTAGEIAAAPAPSAAPAESSASAEVRPTASTIARQATSSPAVAQNPLALDTPASSPSLTVARTSPTRSSNAAAPSATPLAAAAASPTRSARNSPTAISPRPVESPALAEASDASRPSSPQPAQLALARGETGTAGIGASVNLDTAAPTSEGASTVASASAARATARSTRPGPELSPSAPAQVARANAGDPVPQATMVAIVVPNPNTPGADEASPLNASSSAALTQADSQAEASLVSAAAGTVQVDLGPTRIVAAEGVSRASGGGQPELNPEQQSRTAARNPAAGAPELALATPTTAEMTAAPSAAGGGDPPRPNPQIDSLAAVAANPGAEAPISGGPSTAIETGPPSETSAAESVAPPQVARAETIEAPPGAAQAGGGEGDPSQDNEPPQLARAAGGSPEAMMSDAELLASAAPSTPGDMGMPDEEDEDEEERLAALAALQGETGPADAGGSPAAGGSIGAAQPGPPSEPTEATLAGSPQIARAESVEAAPGAPEAGGGSLARTRASAGPAMAATTAADAPTLAGAPGSAGDPNIEPLASSAGDVSAPLSGGLLAQAVEGPTGALDGPEAIDAPRDGAPGPQLGRRAASSADADGPLLADATNSGSPGRRQTRLSLAGGLSADAAPEVPSAPSSGEGSVPDMAAVAGNLDDMGEMDMSQLAFEAAGGARPVSVSAPEGPGGVGETRTPEVGVAGRRGQPDAETVHFRDARFVRREVGGAPAVNLTAVAPAEAFAQRLRPKNEGDSAGGGGPPPLTEEAIENGLAFLARHQMPDGSWSFGNFGRGRRGYESETAALESDTAATGLALMAFFGGGYSHQHGKYKDTVRKAVDYLVKNQREDGDLYVRTGGPSDSAMWLYSQGVATLAMCEAYGMTQDPALREPTQRALDFIIAGQNDTRGGWRYSPNYGSDTSVTGWMMMALKSGELAGLDVPSDTFRRVEKWLDSAQLSAGERHLYVYNPQAPNTPQQAHGRRPNPTMTSVGLLMRLYTGWSRDNPDLARGAEYLLSNPPAVGTRRDPQRDTYYWYYATQVLFHMGGDYWKAWNDQLHPLLIQSQETAGPMAGSWNPRTPVPDRWGPHCGRLYVTTLNLLSLEVYYRHLPLYVETGR